MAGAACYLLRPARPPLSGKVMAKILLTIPTEGGIKFCAHLDLDQIFLCIYRHEPGIFSSKTDKQELPLLPFTSSINTTS